jgi:predicted PurR-regulated permease PerM
MKIIKRRKRMMTKAIKLYITLISLLLIAVFIGAAIYLSTLNEKINSVTANYNARREELLLQQQFLQERINQLNYTLEVESAINKDLLKQVESLANKTGVLINKTLTNLTSPSKAPQLTPVPIKPAPIITTSAS